MQVRSTFFINSSEARTDLDPRFLLPALSIMNLIYFKNYQKTKNLTKKIKIIQKKLIINLTYFHYLSFIQINL